MDDAVLHRWQARLLALLQAGRDPAEIRAALLADPELGPLHAYAAGLARSTTSSSPGRRISCAA